jgi:uncharacterized protein
MNSGFPAGRVDLNELRAGPVKWSGILPAEAGAWGLDELGAADAPLLEYRAEAGGRGSVRVAGRLTAMLKLTCRRCLEGIEWPMEVAFDFRFDPAVKEWEEDGGVFTLDPNAASLDLVRPLREEWVLGMPDYPVCQEGGRGLCSVCGADLNESDCRCTPRQGDDRWAVLRQMLWEGQPEAAKPDNDD